MSRLFGKAKVSFHHAQTTLCLPLKSGGSVALADLIKPLTPSCWLNPFIFNGDAQTVATLVKSMPVKIHYKRRIFEADDPAYLGHFAVDFVAPPSKDHDDKLPPRTTYYSEDEFANIGSDDTKPMLVVLHGLSGGSHEMYLRAFLEPLVASEHNPQGGGWEACVVISRGCSMTTISSTILYNARATWDVRQTVKWLRKKFPNRPLFGAGFSLGGNILTNYLGEEGEKCELQAAVVFSSVWNMEVAAKALQRTWWHKEVYNRALGTNMKKLFERHVDQISKIPGINVDKVRNITYLFEFDRYVQGPTWGYPSEGAYYRDASSIDAMLGIRIPLLAIHAEDDPVCCSEVLPVQEVQVTPYVVLCSTTLGGHLGWFENGGGRWFVKPSTSFLDKMYKDVQLDKISRDELGPLEGYVKRDKRAPLRPVFDPVRRKLHLPVDQ
ncbi:uncharacterized protein HMPREF1541_05100 [Cyphellophora europaea CBS 101466]|uniref:alcohol O-acetyltransferase n=1 Tax=Cyphellophora europaea (strain CBS 101466) TaxID=1220924 RepID=W2RWW1_CYPE1|nr:uncharacterized protein HMPREF1541_05100 [Cyphellophora europaea CBS 101466]ETN40820.1 hypothetical protein HMPREF1541_05100 [Cyphellophora europaea CBS 101466]